MTGDLFYAKVAYSKRSISWTLNVATRMTSSSHNYSILETTKQFLCRGMIPLSNCTKKWELIIIALVDYSSSNLRLVGFVVDGHIIVGMQILFTSCHNNDLSRI